MLNAQVFPLARHILENANQPIQPIIDQIDGALSHKSAIVKINEKTNVNVKQGEKGWYITGFFHENGYHFDETHVYIRRTSFPVSMMLSWDKAIEKCTMTGRRLVEIEPLLDRKVQGYKVDSGGGYTLFWLEDCQQNEKTDWAMLRQQLIHKEEA